MKICSIPLKMLLALGLTLVAGMYGLSQAFGMTLLYQIVIEQNYQQNLRVSGSKSEQCINFGQFTSKYL